MQKSIFAFDNSIAPAKLALFCIQTGIDTVILHPGFFDNDSFLRVLRQNNLNICLNIPVFFNEKYLAENPEAYGITSKGNRTIHSWLHMVCPSRIRYLENLKTDIKNLIQRVNPDFISYDFIRFFVFWEEVNFHEALDNIEHGCYCKECRESFRRFSGENINIDNGIINNSQRNILGEWKTGLINNTVRELNALIYEYNKNIPIYTKTIPWKNTDFEQGQRWIAGQDVKVLSQLTDGVIPMAFTQILGQTPKWKKELLDHVKKTTGREVMSYIQFESLKIETPITSVQLEEEILAALEEKRTGLVYFHYEQIAENPEKQEIIKKYRVI